MINAVVLAAGQSRRMGAQKLLLPLGGRPVIAHIVDEVLRGPVDRVLVIVGPGGKEVVEAITDRRVSIVTNQSHDGDMLSSVRCGLRAIPDEGAVLVALGDQPGITSDVIALVVRTFFESGRGIVVPTYNGRRGHPLLFSLRYREEILRCYGDVGLRGLLAAHPEDVCEVDAAHPGVLEDMDLPEDYDRAVSAYNQKLEKDR
jgi:molybdenum cofactor cytidylyltransferase